MDDAFLMRVLNRQTDRQEQFQSLARSQAVLIAILRDGHALDQLHHKVGPPGANATGLSRGRARVEHLGNVRVVHQRQRLPFRFKAGNDLTAIHAGLDNLQGNFALDGLGLLGHEDGAHAAFADLLEQLVGTDTRPHSLGQQPLAQDRSRGGERMRQKTSGLPNVRDCPANGLGRDERLRQKTSELLLLGKQTF